MFACFDCCLCCCSWEVREVVVGFQGLAAGLAHIHSKGLVDQDLFPGNVLLKLDGSAWVKADLGNAASVELDGKPNLVHCCM